MTRKIITASFAIAAIVGFGALNIQAAQADNEATYDFSIGDQHRDGWSYDFSIPDQHRDGWSYDFSIGDQHRDGWSYDFTIGDEHRGSDRR